MVIETLKLFEFDKKYEVTDLRSLLSLNNEHVYPNKMQK